MLSQMARQALQPPHERRQHPDARRVGIDAALAQQGRELVMLILKFVDVVQLGEAIDLVGRKAQHLAGFAHGAAHPIGDHVGRHRRAACAVTPVDVLDHLLALRRRSADRYRYPAIRRVPRTRNRSNSNSILTASTAVIPSA